MTEWLALIGLAVVTALFAVALGFCFVAFWIAFRDD